MISLYSSSNIKGWNRQFNEYISWNKRQPSEIVNQKLYFVAVNSQNYTKTATKQEITSELNAKSNKYPNKTIGELLVLKQLKARGKMPKRGKTLGKNMASYVQRFINRRASHTQFLRSGWSWAITKLNYWNRKADIDSITFSRRFAPKKPPGIKTFGAPKGDVIPARPGIYGTNCRGTIFNFIGKKSSGGRVTEILQAGLDKAVNKEIREMRKYCDRKYMEYHRRLQNRGFFSEVN